MQFKKFSSIVCGVGINDLSEYTRGNPYYIRWKSVISRCYSNRVHTDRPAYLHVTCCNQWLTYSNFKGWMESQDWSGLHLDKDILIPDSKVYSPEACAFVPKEINCHISLKPNINGLPYGVTISGKKYRARIFYNGKDYYLGSYTSMTEAHKAWQVERANQLEKIVSWYARQTCFRTDIADALTKRVCRLRFESANDIETTTI